MYVNLIIRHYCNVDVIIMSSLNPQAVKYVSQFPLIFFDVGLMTAPV